MKKMKIFLLVCILIGVECFKIDFENGNGHLKLESNAVLDGKIVEEPKVEEVIKKLSGVRYKEPQSEMMKIKHRQPEPVRHYNGNKKDQVKVEYNDYDIPRVFITNINKNINENDMAYLAEDTEYNQNYNIEKKPHEYYRNLAAKSNQTTTTSKTTSNR